MPWNFNPFVVCCQLDQSFTVFRLTIVDKLYVIGGSDGQTSLVSTEVLDISTGTWHVGPTLCTPRANVGVAVIGHRLFAVGGYSGKSFLNSVEYLSDDGEEWCSYQPNIDGESDASSVLSTSSNTHLAGEPSMRWCDDSCHEDQDMHGCEFDECEQTSSAADDELFSLDS